MHLVKAELGGYVFAMPMIGKAGEVKMIVCWDGIHSRIALAS